ncbi:MAG TPA: DNA polymerase III subunit alpha [Bacteroidia bacterium]|nr:DNA polymerase III subunit alpha [Bacteroidia bacterium]
MFLIFDTETTGLPRNYNAPLSDSDNWPRVVQIAWQLHDVKGNLISANSIIVKPNGFTIPFNAAQVHGISTERALAEGHDLQAVMNEFVEAVKQTKYLCGHNIEFDLSIVGAEFIRLGMSDFFAGKPVIDTKNDDVTEFCAIPGGRGGKYKWPKLEELYVKLFNQGFEAAHNAAFDVQATAKAFFELLKRNILKVSELPSTDLQTVNYVAPDLSALLSQEKALKNQDAKSKNEDVKETAKVDVQTSNIKFSHLHNHTQFSVLQAVSDIDDMVKRAISFGSPALAITDHGNMYGAFLFWQSVDKQNKSIKAHNDAIDKGEKEGAKKQELKAIIGCELYICKDRLDKSKQDNGFTQVFLAKNKIGYQNLSKLSSIGFTEGSYYVPRIDREALSRHKEGLIATTGSLSGEIPNLILNIGETQAEEAFVWWKEQFGEDFYVELNNHNLPEESVVNETLLRFAKKYDVKYFAANNNYYLDKKNAAAHDVLLCVKDNQLKETPIGRGRGFRYGFPNQEFYFKSPAEMQKIFSDMPEALENTNEIVNKVESFKLGRDVLLPKFQIPDEFKDARDEDPADEGKGNRGENAYLKHLTYEGAKKRFPDLTPEIRERIDFELATVERMGFPGYFLIVSDFTTEARRLDVSVGPGRGSAAGSAIAYCLGITNIDPIKYDLLFERFLNPDRISMPDIDIDFDDEGRDKVIDYVIKKYGSNQVAQIITYGTMGGKSAIRDAARVLNLPLSDAGDLAKAYPESLAASLKALLSPEGIDKKYLEEIKDRREFVEQSHNFRKLAEGKNLQSEVLKQAYDLEGCVRNTGIHACGVIITPDEMSKFVPVTKAKDSDMLVTQFDNSVAESAGLLKMDFLGLRTLTIIKDALKHIKHRHKIEIDIDAIPLDDKKTYELFQRGETNGIFQFESAGMQKYMKDLKPDSFTDLIAMNALYRPGPIAYIPNYINRKHGKEPIVYDLEGMDEYLKETYGITVYQEQVMRLSQKLANFSKGDADVLRKAMGKKQKDVLDKMKSKFVEGCAKNGHDTKICEKVWIDWEAFASYAFNKSHSTCYAYLAFQTAYLKANYPSEFMASVLTHNMGDITKVTFFMEESKRMGIKVLGPDVNESIGDFSVNENGDIRFGMAAIKGVGSNVVEGIVTQRSEAGHYASIFDLAKRLDTKAINKKSLEALSLAGAFDSFEGITRSMFFAQDKDGNTLTEKLIRYGNSFNTGTETNQASLFGEDSEAQISEPPLPKVEPWGQLEQLAKEKEVVGFYISGHPLDQYKLVIQHACKQTLPELADLKALEGKDVTVAGIITTVQHRTSKTGKPFGTFAMEDYMGSFEFILFGEDYIKFKNYMSEGFQVFVRAKVQTRFGQAGNFECKIQKIDLLSEIKDKTFNSIKLKVGASDVSNDFIDKIELLINTHPGKCNIEIHVEDKAENLSVKMFSKTKKIDINDEFMNEINRLTVLEYDLK